MIRLFSTFAVAAVLAGCSPMGMADTRGTAQQTRFGNHLACEPVNWVSLRERADQLPEAERRQVDLLLTEAQDSYADGERGRCIQELQQAERIVEGWQ
ncbi:MAG TPA: hypothetical protein VK943_15610 [Arenibaculum sp.]|nr:hypothetical protein [Arenibaculum sp.]